MGLLRVGYLSQAVITSYSIHYTKLYEPFGPHPLPGVLVLFPRQGRGGDPAAELPGGMDGQPTPAGADLQQVIGRHQFEFLADDIERNNFV